MSDELKLDQDKQSQERSDTVAEYEISLGFRVKELPKSVRDALTVEGIEVPAQIRFSRVNPFRRAAIAEAVQRRFHRDLRDPEILSNAQVLKLVEERGEWSGARQREMDDLQEETTREMGRLWAEGLTPETYSFSDGILKAHARFHELIDQKIDEAKRDDLRQRFDLWVSWSERRAKEDKTGRFPTNYQAGLELQRLVDDAPGVEAVDILNDLEDLKERQEALLVLSEKRTRLSELQLQHARIFSDTAESRRDHTEQLAQLYWTCERADADGKPLGKLAKDFDTLWNWPDAAVQWLLYEAFFFHNNIPDVAREYLGAFGFFTEGRESTESDRPDESPAPQSSKTDSAPVVETPVSSSESTPATT